MRSSEVLHRAEYAVYGFDISPRGHVLPSALSRIAQQAATDHLAAMAMSSDNDCWVLRRNVLGGWRGVPHVDRLLVVLSIVSVGRCWLESCMEFLPPDRTTGANIRASWVRLDRRSRRPVPLAPAFRELCRPGPGRTGLAWRSEARSRSWTFSDAEQVALREADFDALGHVNSARYFDLIESLASGADEILVEYDSPIDWPTRSAILRTGHDGTDRVFSVESVDGARTFGHGYVRSARREA